MLRDKSGHYAGSFFFQGAAMRLEDSSAALPHGVVQQHGNAGGLAPDAGVPVGVPLKTCE